MKANHNVSFSLPGSQWAVSNGSKILKWKQITTATCRKENTHGCFQWFKDTKMKANHNKPDEEERKASAVSNGSKILKWKQITTRWCKRIIFACCFQWFKDTKMKANHNKVSHLHCIEFAVSNGSKILKWKQITTELRKKGTNFALFPMVQRY